MRPVIIVGPLNEAVVDQLEQDFPHVFQRCIPEKMKGSLSMMERGLQELKFVDFRRRGNHFESTTVTAIKQFCDKVSVMFNLYVRTSFRKLNTANDVMLLTTK